MLTLQYRIASARIVNVPFWSGVSQLRNFETCTCHSLPAR